MSVPGFISLQGQSVHQKSGGTMLPESLAHNTGLAILFALGIVAASVATAALLPCIGPCPESDREATQEPAQIIGNPGSGSSPNSNHDSSGTVWHSPGDDLPFPVTCSVPRFHI